MSYVLAAAAWPYTNGPRHVGHVAGFGMPCDVFARYMRMAGHDVLMVSGTDEHGTPILVQAEQEGVAPQALADRYNRVIVEDLVQLGLSYDLFTRTTTVNHHQVAQELFRTLHANGYMIEQTTKGAISPSTGRTLPDRYIEGTCPLCGADGARGDQCDVCGNQLDAAELINPRSRINGETPEFIETQHFFLDLPAVAESLNTWLDSHADNPAWRPNVYKFSLNIVKEARPRAMTRDIDWGIRIPLPGWEELPTKRLYVWFDAVIGYLSASIEWARRTGNPQAWRQWWNDPEAQSHYFMGKDNITFHSQIWPGELIAHNGSGAHGGKPGELGMLSLPTCVVASEYLTMEGGKFSTSRGRVLYIRDVLSRYQPDALRYYLCAAGPETNDADFQWSEFVRRNNDELVASWGNLVNRTASLIHKNVGHIPTPGAYDAVDIELLALVDSAFAEVGQLISQHKLKAALGEAMRTVAAVNKYLADTAPWQLKKTDPDRMATVLYVAAQAISDCNTILSPFLPHSAQQVHEAFGRSGVIAPLPRIQEVTDLDDEQRHYPIITGDYSDAHPWRRVAIESGLTIPAPRPIFTKLDPEVADQEIARMVGDQADQQG